MKRTAYTFIIGLFVFGISINSCTEEPNELESQHFKLIDSLVLKEKEIAGAALDSICDLHFDEKVAVAVDSIMKVRLKEIKEIMESE